MGSPFSINVTIITLLQCNNPCKSMTVFTNLKYKNVNIKDPSITIILPKYIEVTKEVFVHSLISLGKIFTFKNIYLLYSLYFSGRGGWILGDDSWDQSSASQKHLWETEATTWCKGKGKTFNRVEDVWKWFCLNWFCSWCENKSLSS